MVFISIAGLKELAWVVCSPLKIFHVSQTDRLTQLTAYIHCLDPYCTDPYITHMDQKSMSNLTHNDTKVLHTHNYLTNQKTNTETKDFSKAFQQSHSF